MAKVGTVEWHGEPLDESLCLLLAKPTLKACRGFRHGMPTTEAKTINADLLTFLHS
jgi:hypothetical protein